MAAKKKSSKRKIGRDAKTGRFITVKAAQTRSSTSVIETIKVPTSSFYTSSVQPMHSTSGVSATAIRKSLNIKAEDVMIAKKVVAKRRSKKKTARKK